VHDAGYRHAGRGVAVRPALLRLRCAGDPTAVWAGRAGQPVSAATARPGSGVADRVRRSGLAPVMVGALSVSVRGQVQAVEPLLGRMSVVLALTNDLAALLALNELMGTQRRAVRRWAWAVLVLSGGTAAGLNTWHALEAGELPPLWAVVVGIGPVLLAVVLSHLVALVLDDAPEQSEQPPPGRPAARPSPLQAERPPTHWCRDPSIGRHPLPCGRGGTSRPALRRRQRP
jgi:hypothetical protein